MEAELRTLSRNGTAHLGLTIPRNPEACHMQVGVEDVTWKEGRVIVFDDMHPHEVWNNSAGDRVVLLLQVKRPQRFPGSLVRDAFFSALRRSSLVQNGLRNLEQWEKPCRAAFLRRDRSWPMDLSQSAATATIVGIAIGVILILVVSNRKSTHRKKRPMLPCPCCGFRTLHARGSYEMCSICAWEDDGQNDPAADDVFNGPNGTYSLTEARANFLAHGDMYSRRVTREVSQRPSPARASLLADVHRIVDGIDFDDNRSSLIDYVHAVLTGAELLDEDRLRNLLLADARDRQR